MPNAVSWYDRLRVEWVVWSFDQRLYDLPGRTRIAHRREVRANLLTAAAEVGAAEALHRLGSARELAAQYRDAEFGEGPRHSWWAAALFALTTPLVLNFFLSEAANAYGQAITTTGTHLDGSYTWAGVAWLQSPLTFDLHQGQVTHAGGAYTPLTYVLLVAGTVACGRLWRLLPVWRGKRTGVSAGAQ